jgi:signal transduction histidine kinase
MNLILARIRYTDILRMAAVFLVLVAATMLGQYIFYTLHTSPALIWPVSGIVFAAVLIWGYRMLIPIALASLVGSFMSPAEPPMMVILATACAQILQPFIGVYILRRFGFQNSFERVRDIVLFILVAFATPVIVPSIMVFAQNMAHTLTDPISLAWTRGWAARVTSILVLTPLILSFATRSRFKLSLGENREEIAMFALLSVLLVLRFWTPLVADYITLVAYFILAILSWIALRFDLRAMTRALFIMALVSISGTIVHQGGTAPINEALFSLEIGLILFVPIFYLFSVLSDERWTAVRSLEEVNEKLDTENQYKNEFIAILAHELRNPLATIMSTLEVLQMGEQTPDTARMIESAQIQTVKMRRILEDQLDVARIAQKKFKLKKEYIEINGLVRDNTDFFSGLAKSHDQRFSISLPQADVWIAVDPTRLEQIITNLIDNATKYTARGGRIALSLSVVGGSLEIRVADNGVGIKPEEIEHVFESFKQSTANIAKHSGLGLGLSITRQLVEMHGGTIRAESAGEGKGATFIVRLPLSPYENDGSALVSDQEVTPVPGSPEKQTRKILVVDDNRAMAQGLAMLLTSMRHDVRVAYDGEGALKEIETFKPDAIVLDIGLPDMSGYEVARRLRNAGFTELLLALTGYGQPEDKQRAREAGFDHHFTKPISVAELSAVLS